MITREMMVAAIEALGVDAYLWGKKDYCLNVTLVDFEGFDEDWSEIFRDFDDEKAVEAFLEMLERECISQEGNFYTIYHFEGFDVKVGYTSFDI